MKDSETTIAQIKEHIKHFVSARDWAQFHTPKNLSMSIAIEAAELMEHFQWETPEESELVAQDREKFSQVKDELADIVVYALGMANVLEIDISEAIKVKMEKNAAKYPAEQVRGSKKKYTEYRQRQKPDSRD